MKISKFFPLLFFLISANASQFKWPEEDKTPEKWINNAKETINSLLNRKLNGNIAKNLIMFLGDGMGIPTVTAGRIRKGQMRNKSGEEEITFMESLGNVALAKTYSVDGQTSDSASTATAFLCGIKTGSSIIGLNGNAIKSNCKSSRGNEVDSILKWAHKAGKLVGIVSTTRITHATPAAAYANVPDRKWESYEGIAGFSTREKNDGCSDIASQLIYNSSYINVIFGGGRKKFLHINGYNITENSWEQPGDRVDEKINLINDWIEIMKQKNKAYKFISNASELRELNIKEYDHVLGLFSHDHMTFETDRDPEKEPSLIEMTQKAIELLEKGDHGYFLLVEGGLIDHGHHLSQAKKAVDEFVVFDSAIGKALSMTSENDTLIVVTSDHSHTFSLGGSSVRGNDIYGIAIRPDFKFNTSDLLVTYTSLLYGNGPGGIRKIRTRNLTNEETGHKNYVQESAIYLRSETHGGEDVAIFAKGPMSHLFEGTVEQSFIPHAMAYAACIGPIYGQDKNCLKERGIHSISSKNFIIIRNLYFFMFFIILQ